MLIPSPILFVLFLLLSAFFSAMESAFIALSKEATPYLIDNKEINIEYPLRGPLSVPDSDPIERPML